MKLSFVLTTVLLTVAAADSVAVQQAGRLCRSKCQISRAVFDKAMDSVWGAVQNP
jgi:hypothetical protein